MEQCCHFVYKFKDITWTKTALTICMIPFVLLLMVLMLILLCSVESQGAVVSNSKICAKIGSDILKRGGSVTDAAVGTLMCEGITLPSSAGIGGGFTGIIRMEGQFDSIIATPTLPAAVRNINNLSITFSKGAKAVGVPGELMGYWEMHQKYGMLSWKEIVQPSVDLCLKGFPITEWLSGVLRYNAEKLASSATMSRIFNNTQNELYKQNFVIKFPELGKTLGKIADEGVSVFYGGKVGQAFVKDIQDAGGLITLDDLKSYKVLWNNQLPYLRMNQEFKVVTTPPPSTGVLVVLILNIIKALRYDEDINVFWHYLIEAMKYSFGISLTLGDGVNDPMYADVINKTYDKMRDPDFARYIREQIRRNITISLSNYFDLEAHFGEGSTNICILAPNGDIFAGTTSLFKQFGSYFCSLKTGIITNNLLSRFLGEENESLFNQFPTDRPIPNKHFVSAHNPAIVLDSLEKPYFIIGSSGGARAITLMAVAIIRYVLFGETASDAVSTEYLHHQLLPDWVEYGEKFSLDVRNYLEKIGYQMVLKYSSFGNVSSSICIGHRNRDLDPQYNIRIGGSKEFIKGRQELGFILVAIVFGLCILAIGVMLYEVLNPRKHLQVM